MVPHPLSKRLAEVNISLPFLLVEIYLQSDFFFAVFRHPQLQFEIFSLILENLDIIFVFLAIDDQM